MISSKNTGLARVIIPSDVERDIYIRRCYDTGRVSIFTYGAGVIRQASIAKHCINDIEFPESATDFGCVVAYNKIPKKEEYIIYAVLKEIGDVYDVTEYQYSIGRKSTVVNRSPDGKLIVSVDEGISKIAGDADDGSMTVTVNHSSKGGTLAINIGNSKSGGTMSIQVSGVIKSDSDEVDISAYNKISFKLPKSKTNAGMTFEYEKGKGLLYSDEFGNGMVFDENNMQIAPAKLFNVGTGKERMVLGDTYKTQFEEFTDILDRLATACSVIIVSTSFGKSLVPDNAADFIQISKDLSSAKLRYEEFLSTVSNTD